jgi:hypothetical protein
MEEFIAIQIMVAQAQRLYPKLNPFDPNCQHIAFLNSHVKSFFKQFKNTDTRHFKFHWEFIYGKIFSNEYFPVISRIGPQGREGRGFDSDPGQGAKKGYILSRDSEVTLSHWSRSIELVIMPLIDL